MTILAFDIVTLNPTVNEIVTILRLQYMDACHREPPNCGTSEFDIVFFGRREIGLLYRIVTIYIQPRYRIKKWEKGILISNVSYEDHILSVKAQKNRNTRGPLAFFF